MFFLASKSEEVKLSISSLGGTVSVLRQLLLIHLPFTTTLFQVMLPREQMQTDFLRTRLLLRRSLFPHPLVSSS